MSKFYSYIAPIAFMIISFIFIPKIFGKMYLGDYDYIAYILFSFGIPFIWMRIIAKEFNDRTALFFAEWGMVLLIGWIIFVVWLDGSFGP